MKPEDIYNGLEYTTKEINRTFKIKVNGLFTGKKINTLVGVSGLIKLVGVEMANKLLRRAFLPENNTTFTTSHLRGLQRVKIWKA